MGKSSINGPFSMAMLNNQRVELFSYNTPFLKQTSVNGLIEGNLKPNSTSNLEMVGHILYLDTLQHYIIWGTVTPHCVMPVLSIIYAVCYSEVFMIYPLVN